MTQSQMTLPIEIRDLSFRYREDSKNILEGINLAVQKGEILAVVGLSGSGKTTLCYCISGIIPNIYQGELTGQVLLQGQEISGMDLPQIATRLGIVFQNPETQLFFPVVEDELAFGPENLCLERDEIGRRIKEVLAITGMSDRRHESPHHLSGGQQQMIALASVLSLEPEILIFDEVMSRIDEKGKGLIKKMIVQLKKNNKTVVMIEHDYQNLDVADRTLQLREGRLVDFNGTLNY